MSADPFERAGGIANVSGRRAKPDAGTLLEIHLRELGYEPLREYRFDMRRRWRADFCVWPKDQPIHEAALIEIEGAVWTQGRHTRGAGYVKDLEKYNAASAIGYRVFRFTPQQVLDGSAKAFLKENLQ